MPKKPKTPGKRDYRLTFSLNEEEKRVVEQYLQSHQISNRSNWAREVILRSILAHEELDLPMLFSEYEMRR